MDELSRYTCHQEGITLEDEGAMTDDMKRAHRVAERIPGERDPENLTHREPGAMGGQPTGADIPPDPELPWLDEATAEERAREGGLTGTKAKRRRPQR